MTASTKAREHMCKQEPFITDCLQLNGINLFACIIVLGVVHRLMGWDMCAINTAYDTFKTIGILKEVGSSFLCFTVGPFDVLCHEFFHQHSTQLFNYLEDGTF